MLPHDVRESIFLLNAFVTWLPRGSWYDRNRKNMLAKTSKTVPTATSALATPGGILARPDLPLQKGPRSTQEIQVINVH